MIKELIESESIKIVFQPIVSIKRKSIIAMEALCRGIWDNEIIMPGTLFSQAASAGLTVELDRLCRRKALESFATIQNKLKDVILSINFDASTVDQGIVGSGVLLDLVRSAGVNPGNVAIEINESRANDLDSLKKFINKYRGYGFIIALDDIGAGHSNLNRVAITRPDILKIDRSLVSNLDSEYYKQEVFRSLVSLSKNIGALAVAEGIEREEEALTALDYGVDMLQGFYYSIPLEADTLLNTSLAHKIEATASRFKEHSIQKLTLRTIRNREFDVIIRNIIDELRLSGPANFNNRLIDMINRHHYLECLYILDESGVQVSKTVCNHKALSTCTRPTFRPAPTGTDHSLKDYYYLLTGSGLVKYMTEPYISLASGNLCTTISALFENDLKQKYILCLDANSSNSY
ncbi:MAG: EAL domain-containing protein [Desulfocucumaceae bacterium]